MTFSRPLLGTDKKKTKLSLIEYILFSCIQQGWYNCYCSFCNWADLIGNSYQGYGILPEDDDLEWCNDYFWDSLQDDIYPKEFLEHLMQLADDVKTGKEEVIPLDEDFFDRLKDLVKDVELEELDDISHLLNQEEDQ